MYLYRLIDSNISMVKGRWMNTGENLADSSVEGMNFMYYKKPAPYEKAGFLLIISDNLDLTRKNVAILLLTEQTSPYDLATRQTFLEWPHLNQGYEFR